MGKYRKNVGIVVSRQDGKVLMCARADCTDYQWQFPQGGIDAGETVLEAAYRELKEETGLTSVEFITQLPYPLRYDFPPEILAHFQKTGCPYVGQEQEWVLFRLSRNNTEIDFCSHPEEIEFKAYEWVEPDEAPKRIIDFKKPVYSQMIDYFKPYLLDKNND